MAKSPKKLKPHIQPKKVDKAELLQKYINGNFLFSLIIICLGSKLFGIACLYNTYKLSLYSKQSRVEQEIVDRYYIRIKILKVVSVIFFFIKWLLIVSFVIGVAKSYISQLPTQI